MSKVKMTENPLKVIVSHKKESVFLLVALVLLVFSFFVGGTDKNTDKKSSDTNLADYESTLEKRLEKLLGEIDGVGTVEVMLTLENGERNVYATESGEKQKSGENSADTERSQEYVKLKRGASNEECVILSKYEPRVRGVAVVASGAGDTRVKIALTETVCAVFNIPSTSVSVVKMTKEK